MITLANLKIKNSNPIITYRNTKIEKSNDSVYKAAILHLAPFDLSGHNVCGHASNGCIKGCLNTAGHGVYNKVQAARIRRTKLLFSDRKAFLDQIYTDLEKFVYHCEKRSLKPAFRLNGTSDIDWSRIAPQLFKDFSEIQFWDYTKFPLRFNRYLDGKLPVNYHLTFSRSEDNKHWVDTFLKSNHANIAVVFFGKIPETYLGREVIDGDKSDFRFLDKSGVIVGLKAKGKAKKDTTGFVVREF